ncbi:MAG: DUF1028 domain-containing protein [Nitrososphaerota archaeon]|nr:DUF1028 domain-containing protein [Candidatus Bathyarchaeota archaeon]MDW8023066.1 DUF1028 domain-containing protein [Nitrososphaerota archaeon]
MEKTGTFSILAISEHPKLIGVAVASGSTSVGIRVPHAKPGVGVVATQAYTNVAYGVEGLKLLAAGYSPAETLDKLLKEDLERQMRQVAILDFAGRKVAFTGFSVPEWRGEIMGENYIVIGNLLRGRWVLESMAAKFEGSDGSLAWRMVGALEAGAASGGDKRGERSAALIVADHFRVLVNLRVDMHKDPVRELHRQLRSECLPV